MMPSKVSSNEVLSGPMSLSMLGATQGGGSISGESVIAQFMSRVREQSKEVDMNSEHILKNFREQDGLFFLDRAALESCSFI
jgi:hypothetical protein